MGKIAKNGKSQKVNSGENNYFKTLMLIGILFVVFCTPFLRGLYFEPEQFCVEIIIFSIFIIFWIFKLIKNDKAFLRTPIEYAGFGLTLIYLLSVFTAVSQRLAFAEFFKYVMYFVVFLMLSDLIKNKKEKTIVLWFIVASALGACIIGIDSAAGSTIVNILNGIFRALNLNVEFFGLFVDGRIHSTMQYPNAFASYLLGVFFVALGLMMTSDKWIKSLLSSICFVLLLTFIFTVSRGAYILLVFAVITFLLLLPKQSRLIGLYNLFSIGIITGAFSVVISKFIYGTATNKIYIWLFVILGALVSFYIRLTDNYVDRILNKINWKFAATGTLVFVTLSVVFIGIIFNASVPLELSHSIDEKEGYKGVTKRIVLSNNKKYNLVFNVEGTTTSDKANFVYRVSVKSKDEKGIVTDNDVLLADKRYKSTKGFEEKNLEFTVPENSKIVSIQFLNYYAGTNVKFYDAKIIEVDSGKEVKRLLLKHKYSFAESILARFENLINDKSYNTRIIFIKDGFNMFKDWWLIGAGGGAWSILNFKYQSYLYWSTQTHNYPLQVLVETGLVGFIMLLLLLLSIVLSFIKLYKKSDYETHKEKVLNGAIFTAVIFLFLHAVLDFDFSLSSIYLLVWVLVAVLNADIRKYFINEETVIKKKSKKKNNLTSKEFIGVIKNRFSRGFNAYPIVMIVLGVIVLIHPIIFYKAYSYSNKAINFYKENELDKAIEMMEKATSLDYLNTEYVTGYTPISSRPDIRLGYIDLIIKKMGTVSNDKLGSEEKAVLNNYVVNAQKLADRAEDQAKHNPDLSLCLGIYYLNTSDKEKGIDYINKSVELKRFVPVQWNYKANAIYATAISYFQRDEKEKGLELIESLLNMIDEAKAVNKANIVPFVFNTSTQEYLEKGYYIKNDLDNNQVNVNNLVFRSIFEMDIDGNNMPDQWNVSDKDTVQVNIGNGYLSIANDLKNDSYIYTRDLVFEPESEYLVEVELVDSQDIKSIPFIITGIKNEASQLSKNNNTYSAKFNSSQKVNDKSQLRIYIKDEYKIKSVKIVRTN